MQPSVSQAEQQPLQSYSVCVPKTIASSSARVEMTIDENPNYHRRVVISKQADNTWKMSEYYSG